MPGLDTRLDWEAINAVLAGLGVSHQAQATETPRVTKRTTAPVDDPLADLLQTPIGALTAPLAVASSILGDTLYLVANDHQAATVRRQGGVPYSPQEVDLLWELHQAVKPEVWGERLKLIHAAKKRFQGKLEL